MAAFEKGAVPFSRQALSGNHMSLDASSMDLPTAGLKHLSNGGAANGR